MVEPTSYIRVWECEQADIFEGAGSSPGFHQWSTPGSLNKLWTIKGQGLTHEGRPWLLVTKSILSHRNRHIEICQKGNFENNPIRCRSDRNMQVFFLLSKIVWLGVLSAFDKSRNMDFGNFPESK